MILLLPNPYVFAQQVARASIGSLQRGASGHVLLAAAAAAFRLDLHHPVRRGVGGGVNGVHSAAAVTVQ